jgi:hypothetical protein
VVLLGASALTGACPVRADDSWTGDLAPLDSSAWNTATAAHLLERAGFGGTIPETRKLARLTPATAVRQLVLFDPADVDPLQFDPSGVFDDGLDPFPPSRPATTKLAKEHGEALGIRSKPGGNRPIQPIVNQFFYWLRASRLETDRVAYWWANQMLQSPHPLPPSGSCHPGIGFGVCAQRRSVHARGLAPSASRHLPGAAIDCCSGAISSTGFDCLSNVDFPSDVIRGDSKETGFVFLLERPQRAQSRRLIR